VKFQISDRPIDRDGLRRALQRPDCGALAVFEGWVRDHNEGRAVLRLEYEVYRPLAESEGLRILREAAQRFGIGDATCVHREGLLELGEAAVIVLVAAAHRDAAFRACRYIIDEAKRRLPIWKKEYYADGEAHWVNCRHCAARPAADEAAAC
jgi:molybdopterin synthase catalytic subunit